MQKNLFQQKDNIVLHQIQALTGLFLLEQTDFPAYICGPCVVALREAIEFRERVIRTQKLLLSSDSVENAFEAIDFEEVGKLHLDDGDQTELSNSHEEITVYGYPNYENECDTDIENHINEIKSETESMEEDISAVPVQNQDKDLSITAALSDETTMLPNMQHKTEKPTSKLYATVNFASNGKHTPRINWSKLSEDEIVMLKRERRKRDCICELCGRHFACPSNFKVHLLRHTGVKNFPCAQCPLKFYTPHLLRRHELAHLCQKPYPCQFCGQTFADYSGRIQHERNRHTNYKPYKCTKCEKAFAVSTKLKRHMLSHSGVRSFHCELRDQSGLPTHICGSCVVSLSEAIAFRERIIRTQQLLLSSKSVAKAFNLIDMEQDGEQTIKMPVYNYGEDGKVKEALEDQLSVSALDIKPPMNAVSPQPNVQLKRNRSASPLSLNYCKKLAKNIGNELKEKLDSEKVMIEDEPVNNYWENSYEKDTSEHLNINQESKVKDQLSIPAKSIETLMNSVSIQPYLQQKRDRYSATHSLKVKEPPGSGRVKKQHLGVNGQHGNKSTMHGYLDNGKENDPLQHLNKVYKAVKLGEQSAVPVQQIRSTSNAVSSQTNLQLKRNRSSSTAPLKLKKVPDSRRVKKYMEVAGKQGDENVSDPFKQHLNKTNEELKERKQSILTVENIKSPQANLQLKRYRSSSTHSLNFVSKGKQDPRNFSKKLKKNSADELKKKIHSESVEKLFLQENGKVNVYWEDGNENDPLEHQNNVKGMPIQNVKSPSNAASPQTSVQDKLAAGSHERGRFECKVCCKHLATRKNLGDHLLTHTGVQNFTCNECPMTFYTKDLLQFHTLTHLNKKPY